MKSNRLTPSSVPTRKRQLELTVGWKKVLSILLQLETNQNSRTLGGLRFLSEPKEYLRTCNSILNCKIIKDKRVNSKDMALMWKIKPRSTSALRAIKKFNILQTIREFTSWETSINNKIRCVLLNRIIAAILTHHLPRLVRLISNSMLDQFNLNTALLSESKPLGGPSQKISLFRRLTSIMSIRSINLQKQLWMRTTYLMAGILI